MIVASHASKPGLESGVVEVFDISPIVREDIPVAGYDEAVKLIDDCCPYSDRIELHYTAEAIVLDGVSGDFERVPVKVLMRREFSGETTYEIVDVCDDGIELLDVGDCVSIEINGRCRYRGNGRGTIEVLFESEDSDSMILEKKYESVSKIAHAEAEERVTLSSFRKSIGTDDKSLDLECSMYLAEEFECNGEDEPKSSDFDGPDF